MRTFYYRVTANFGDHMNSWLWPRLMPELIEERSEDVLVGIGSLIKSDLGKVPGRKIIFGTGSGYGPMPVPEEVADWRIYCVRGPLTARLLKLPPEKAVGDAAWLVDRLPELRYQPGPREGTVFVPHWTTDVYANWRQPCADAGINYISPFLPGPTVLGAIAGAKLAIVESLHGAIMADYYRVPWIPVATDGRVLAYKWLDFCMSLDLPFRPIRLPVSDLLERALVGRAEAWSGDVEYLPEAHEADYAQVRYATQRPATRRYRATIKLKELARPVRAGGLSVAAALRATPPYRAAFGARSRQLADLLGRIAEQPAFLSDDAVRQRKLDQLSALLDQLRNDYAPA
jgi:succinoglycan biosynthesis protein ExoV